MTRGKGFRKNSEATINKLSLINLKATVKKQNKASNKKKS
jgi:hypothetical protein